jgi:HSP20 family protein
MGIKINNRQDSEPAAGVKTEAAAQLAEPSRDRPVFAPAADICELRDSFVVLCDMPGVDSKTLDLSLEDGVLSISGVQTEESFGEARLLKAGYETGILRRSFSMSGDIDSAKIRAKLAGGVLKIELPKAERAKPRKISVETA